MPYYPVCLELRDRKCLVIGGGKVAEQKVYTLIACQAAVTVVSPEVTAGLQNLIDENKIIYLRKKYEETDLEGAFVVIAATNQTEINARIYRDASRRNLLVNVVDSPKYCSFITPALVRRGDLLLSVSTSGKSPALAKKIRKKLESEFGEEYQQFLEIMGELREKILEQVEDPFLRRKLFEQLVDSDMIDLLKQGDLESVQEKTLSILEGLKWYG
jgi:precorrin-2 dehydrogenase/sirohydrochlorin ferrochelatase